VSDNRDFTIIIVLIIIFLVQVLLNVYQTENCTNKVTNVIRHGCMFYSLYSTFVRLSALRIVYKNKILSFGRKVLNLRYRN
jgi:hypothetical protein